MGDLPGVEAVSLHPASDRAAPVKAKPAKHFLEITVKRMG
jgi:hypothetical protein